MEKLYLCFCSSQREYYVKIINNQTVTKMKNTLLQRFSKYISYATTADPESETYPSTQALLDFADVMVEELKNIGMQNVTKDQHGYVTALLPSNTTEKQPVIGFMAHLTHRPRHAGYRRTRHRPQL